MVSGSKFSEDDIELIWDYVTEGSSNMNVSMFLSVFKCDAPDKEWVRITLNTLKEWHKINGFTSEEGFKKLHTTGGAENPSYMLKSEFLKGLNKNEFRSNNINGTFLFNLLDTKKDGRLDTTEWNHFFMELSESVNTIKDLLIKHQKSSELASKLKSKEFISKQDFIDDLKSCHSEISDDKAIEIAEIMDAYKTNKIDVRTPLKRLALNQNFPTDNSCSVVEKIVKNLET